MRRSLAVLWFALLTVVPASGAGQELAWENQWDRFGVPEGVATGVMFGGAATFNYVLGPPEEGNWRGGILVDEPVRRALRAEGRGTAEAFATVSDVAAGTLIAYPFAVDAGAVAWAGHGERDVALQTAALGAESFAVSSFLTAGLKYLVARQRPPTEDCREAHAGDLYCSEDRYESFPSGHTSLAFTGASFICAIHEHLELYGGGAPERAACYTALGLATTTGLSRIVSDNHYLSDVLGGAAIGVLSGYVVPNALHFGFGGSAPLLGTRVQPMAAGRPGISVGWRF